MSQNAVVLPTTGVVSGLQMTQATNNAIDTLNTLASGATAPSSPEAGQLWHDTTNNILKLRSLDNTQWIPLFYVNEGAYLAGPPSLGQINGSVNRALNAAMFWDQVNEGSSYTIPDNNTPTYTADQWVVSCLSTGSPSGITAQRVSDAPANFTNSLKVTVGTGAGSVGGGRFPAMLYQPIEANNLSDLGFGASGAVAAFAFLLGQVLYRWYIRRRVAKCSRQPLAGQQILGRQHRDVDADYRAEHFGRYRRHMGDKRNGRGDVGIYRHSHRQHLSDKHAGCVASAGTAFGSTSQTNSVLTTNGATFQLTGVMFNAGAFCQPYEKRFPQAELATLERYFYKTFPIGTAVAQNAGQTGAFSCAQGAAASTSSALSRIPLQEPRHADLGQRDALQPVEHQCADTERFRFYRLVRHHGCSRR